MTDRIRCGCKTQLVTNHAHENYRCHKINCCGLVLQVVVDRDPGIYSQSIRINIAVVDSDCNPFYFALEVYPIPLNKNNIPLRNKTNYFYYASDKKMKTHGLMGNVIMGELVSVTNHHLSIGYLSDPANGFADAEGNFDLSIMFAVNYNEPVEPELCYITK